MAVVEEKRTVNEQVLNLVRDALRARQYTPFELMAYLEAQHELDDAAVREAVWSLLNRFEIEFSGDQKLRLKAARRQVHR